MQTKKIRILKIELPRIYVHIPLGWLNVALIAGGAVLGGPWLAALITISSMFAVGFLVYEVTQGGDPHLDIASWLWGIGPAAGVAFILALTGVL